MHLSTLTGIAVLPLLAVAQSSASATSTTQQTKTITISKVVASVTSTYGAANSSTTLMPTASNSTAGSVGTTSWLVGTTSHTTILSITPTSSPSSPRTSVPVSGASSRRGAFAGGVGLLVMAAAGLF